MGRNHALVGNQPRCKKTPDRTAADRPICVSRPDHRHPVIPELTNDFILITRFLARQFVLASHPPSSQFPWFMEGYTQWLTGGSIQGGVVVGNERHVSISDFKSGDTQALRPE